MSITLEVEDYVQNEEGRYESVNTEIEVGCMVDGVLTIGEEAADSIPLLDYYELGYPWINPKLEEWATANGGYWEWKDPGSIQFFKN